MPVKQMHPCNRPGCPKLTRERFCPEHAHEAATENERDRETAVQRGYDLEQDQDHEVKPRSLVREVSRHRQRGAGRAGSSQGQEPEEQRGREP